MADNYLIWKEKWAPHGWYRPNSSGYTSDVTEAGRYTEEYAREHERASHGDCKAVEYGSEHMVAILRRCDPMAYRVYQLAEFLEKLVAWYNRHSAPAGEGPKGPPTIPEILPESVREKVRATVPAMTVASLATCKDCDDFAETAEGYPRDLVHDVLGPNFCKGHEVSCHGDDIRHCFTPKVKVERK